MWGKSISEKSTPGVLVAKIFTISFRKHWEKKKEGH